MWTISRSRASSARCAAKWAICGLKQQTRSAVASTIARQNSKIASGRARNCSGKRDGSGSRPTQTRESLRRQASLSFWMKIMAFRSRISFCHSLQKVPEADEGAFERSNQDCPHPGPLPPAGEGMERGLSRGGIAARVSRKRASYRARVQESRKRASSCELLVANPMRLRSLLAEPALLVFLVLAIVALEKFHVR